MSYISGIVAAILSPLITTIGFLFWEYFCFPKHHHTWSSFALNLYKCCLATILFLITIFILSIINNNNNDNNESKYYFFWSLAPNDSNNSNNNDTTATNEQQIIIGYLLLSSVIGIIIGDLLWLQALNLLGSVRVIFMDALKPFCATFFGIILLQESFRYTILLGIILTVSGILCMSLDPSQQSSSSSSLQEQPWNGNHDATTTPTTETIRTDTNNDTTAAAKKKLSLKYTIGYSMSFINVVLDTYGSVLTKQYGINISVWEINCIRFGFAGGILLAISVMMMLYTRVTSNHCRCRSSHENQGSTGTDVPNTNNNTQLELHTEPTDALSTIIIPKQNDVTLDVPWYMIPIGNKATMMTKSVWLYISLGVVFVTYIAPTLYNYALFEISLALTLTLTSIGPFYAIPLSYAVQKYLYISKANIDHNTNHELQQQQQQSQLENTKPKCSQLLEPQKPSKLVWIGATFTVAGIVVLAYYGGI